MKEQATQVVVAVAKSFAEAMRQFAPNFNHAFMRFDASDQHIGAKGSYVADGDVSLMSAFRHRQLFDDMLRLATQLREVTSTNGKRFVVCLLHIDCHFDYEVKFEYDDKRMWDITKLDGASGVPTGINLGELSAVKSRDRLSPEGKPWYMPW